LFFFFNTVSAQLFKAGLSAGLLASDIPGTDSRDNDVDFKKAGFTFGGIISADINEKNSFQFEINYIQKGALQTPDSNNNGYFKISLNYVEVPLLIKHHLHFSMGKLEMTRFDLEGGASIGRLVQFAESRDNYAQLIGRDNYNSTEVSVFGGIDYNITSHLYLCVRYSNSVIPAIKRNNVSPQFITYTFNKGSNVLFVFNLKYIFGKAETAVTQ
jgi:hypothetical protein